MPSFTDRVTDALARNDLGGLVDAIPYHRYLGIKLVELDGEMIATLPSSEKLIGNPMLPAIHGGVIGAFLETTAIFHLLSAGQTLHVPKTITITIDYMRSAGPVDTYAKGITTKLGSRIANVRAEAWQSDPAKPVASANLNFLIDPAAK
ncbi:MAG: PaaI family thioesterase [Alphaproteobacteria bacterium]